MMAYHFRTMHDGDHETPKVENAINRGPELPDPDRGDPEKMAVVKLGEYSCHSEHSMLTTWFHHVV